MYKALGIHQLLLGGINDVSTSDSSLVHQVVHLLEFRQTNYLERSLDDTATEELDRLGAVLAVADVRAANSNHLDDRLEDGCAQVCAGWQTNADDSSSRSDVLEHVSHLSLTTGVESIDLLRQLAGMASR